jgi:hypothetical protein
MSQPIDRMSSAKRCKLFKKLFDEAVLPYRRQLLQYRDHTWQSAFIDSDGYLAELIAAIVTGTPGHTRKGKGGGNADLSDGTEVKKGYRLDPNVDFVVRGTLTTYGGARAIELPSLPSELELHNIRGQLNANACSVQLLDASLPANVPLDEPLGRTASKNALVTDDGTHFLKLARDAALPSVTDGSPVRVCIRQERGHINFGKRTRDQLHEMFVKRPPILVFYNHDSRGRPQVVVLRVGLDGAEIGEYLDRIFAGAATKRQVQPYLFPDNIRKGFYASSKHSAVTALRCDLLALGVEAAKGFEVLHWEPDNPPPVSEHLELLTQVAPLRKCPPFSHKKIDVNLGSERARRKASSEFYENTVLPWYESISPFCDQCGVTRNIGLGNLAQHLVSLRVGIRGTRSGARGADLVEEDGSVSDVKLATGEPTELNPMRNTDVPRLNLESNLEKILGWRRIFPVRVCDGGQGLEVLLHAPTEGDMETFRRQVTDYFAQRPASRNLQYHAQGTFPSDSYGVAGRTLTFQRVAWFRPDGRHRFVNVP